MYEDRKEYDDYITTYLEDIQDVKNIVLFHEENEKLKVFVEWVQYTLIGIQIRRTNNRLEYVQKFYQFELQKVTEIIESEMKELYYIKKVMIKLEANLSALNR
eukprot:UN18260